MAISFEKRTLPAIDFFRVVSGSKKSVVVAGFKLNGEKRTVRGSGKNRRQAEKALFEKLTGVEKSALILKQGEIRW